MRFQQLLPSFRANERNPSLNQPRKQNRFVTHSDTDFIASAANIEPRAVYERNARGPAAPGPADTHIVLLLQQQTVLNGRIGIVITYWHWFDCSAAAGTE